MFKLLIAFFSNDALKTFHLLKWFNFEHLENAGEEANSWCLPSDCFCDGAFAAMLRCDFKLFVFIV